MIPRLPVNNPRCGVAMISPVGVTRFCSGIRIWSSLLAEGNTRPTNCPAPATKQPVGQNFAFAVGQIIARTPAILSRRKGRWPSSPNVGMGCGGRGGVGREVCSQGGFRERATARRTYDAEAYGEVVLTPQWLASSLRKASRPDRARMSQLF